jgi:phenylpyruvate tautomerase PptA (4-oxalocrotonate tautomerase family)
MPHINLKAQNPTLVQEGLKELGESLTADLADHVNLPVATVSAVIAELYRRNMVHISGWARNKQGTPIKIYAWGEGNDMKQPLKTSKPKKEVVEEVKLPFPRCDTAASWLTHLVAQN